MTREEMRIKREIKNAIEKTLLKPISKKYGYRIVSGIPYCVHEDWLYTVFVSNTHEHIRMVINVRPLAIDEIFWEIFEMKDMADKKPFSFHVNAAFVPYSFWLEEWKIPVMEVEQTEDVLDQAFADANRKILMYVKQIVTIQDFKEIVQNHEPVNHLNCMLCDIVLGNYGDALHAVEEELAKNHSGGFASAAGGDIYRYIQRYCKNRL